MPIRPVDVRRKEFKNSLRGYDANQVDDFLDSVADEFERIYSDNSRMREEISNLRERLDQFEKLEASIRDALVHAEQAAKDLREAAARDAENMRATASREAELTIREAKSRAHQMLADSSARVERVQESYEALRKARQTFAADFRHLLKSYLEVMDNMDVASAKEIEASLRERMDTESIAAAREAAAQEAGRAREEAARAQEEAARIQEEPADETGDETELMEEPPVSPQAYEPARDVVPGGGGEGAYEEPGEPEVDEPEPEPSSVEDADQETVVYEPARNAGAAGEEAEEQQEGPLAEQRDEEEEAALASERSSSEFFAEESEQEQEEAPEEDRRIFRASRFLRRRE